MLAANLAHRINNPLQGVMGCLKGLREGTVPASMYETYLSLMDEGLERIRDTLQEVQGYARSSSPQGEALQQVATRIRISDIAAVEESGRKVLRLTLHYDEPFRWEDAPEGGITVNLWLPEQ